VIVRPGPVVSVRRHNGTSWDDLTSPGSYTSGANDNPGEAALGALANGALVVGWGGSFWLPRGQYNAHPAYIRKYDADNGTWQDFLGSSAGTFSTTEDVVPFIATSYPH